MLNAMNPFEYLLPLISVIVGLSITDLATSLHRLLRARRRVEWDWLPLATALLALLMVLNAWWRFYRGDSTAAWTVAEFFPVMITLILLFLINAAALPDRVPPEGIDLRAFYESNSSYFWLLFSAFMFVLIFRVISAQVSSYPAEGISEWKEFAKLFTFHLPNLTLAVLFACLARYRNRTFHIVSVIGALLVLGFFFARLSIGGPQ